MSFVDYLIGNYLWYFDIVNTSRYIIATQDRELQEIARSSPGTPVLYLHKKTPTLEQPSKRSIEVAQERSALRCEQFFLVN